MLLPLVTIGIPCFNAGPSIVRAVESALQQTHAAVQVVVVDDGSSDDSLERLLEFGDRIELVSQDHVGGNRARNEILRRARGAYVQYLDADDYLEPAKIERQLQEGPAEADVLYSQVLVEESGLRKPSVLDPRLDVYAQWIAWQLPQTGGCLWKRAALQALGGWNETMPCCQEHELYLRALQAGLKFVHTPSPLAVYCIWSQKTVCRRDPRQVIEVRTGLIEKILDWLVAQGKCTELHRAIAGQAFFEMSRTLAQIDLQDAARYHQKRRSQGPMRLAGDAAPLAYRLVYRLLGFRSAERLARSRRLRHAVA